MMDNDIAGKPSIRAFHDEKLPRECVGIADHSTQVLCAPRRDVRVSPLRIPEFNDKKSYYCQAGKPTKTSHFGRSAIEKRMSDRHIAATLVPSFHDANYQSHQEAQPGCCRRALGLIDPQINDMDCIEDFFTGRTRWI